VEDDSAIGAVCAAFFFVADGGEEEAFFRELACACDFEPFIQRDPMSPKF
jgi:hypothetical protein